MIRIQTLIERMAQEWWSGRSGWWEQEWKCLLGKRTNALFYCMYFTAIMSALVLASPKRFNAPPRRAISVTTKVNVLEQLGNQDNNNYISQVAKDNGVDRALVWRWYQQKDELLATAEKQGATARRVSGAGRHSTIPDAVKEGLLNFVNDRRSQCLPVTPRMLYHEWCRMDPDGLSISENAARLRIYRFMHRNDLVVRRTTHHAQRDRNDPQIIADWIQYCQGLCSMYGITPDRMANFDETDVQFAVHTNRTIASKGQRTVSVRTPVSSNRCTVMLGVAADGQKFPPYVIFKGKNGARVHKEVRKWSVNGYPHSCLYNVQNKVWMDETMMLDWVNRVWKPFATAKNDLTLLFIDQFSVHLMPSVKRAIEDCGTIIEYIPKGYTSCLQVCDIGLNKPFKDLMRSTVNEWLVLNGSDTKPTRQTVSNWISHAWSGITYQTIINTWAHIKIGQQKIVCNDENDSEKESNNSLGGVFLDDNDPCEQDILALRDSYENSSDEDEH